MEKKNHMNFNTEKLVKQIDVVLKNGIYELLNGFMDRHDLLEKTHNKIMNLPSVKNELSRNNIASDYDCESDSDADSDADADSIDYIKKKDITVRESIRDMTVKIVKNEVKSMKEKLSLIEQKMNDFNNVFQVILKEINVLKTQTKRNEVVDLTKTFSEVKIKEEPTFLEKENIKLKIEEQNVIDEEEEELEEEELDEEEDEEELEEEDEDEEEDEELEEDEKSIETENSEKKLELQEEEEELFEIEIGDINYYTNNEENGFIYQITSDDDIGEKIGYIKDGEPFFYEDEK